MALESGQQEEMNWTLERRSVTLELPAEAWAILDGANNLATTAGGQVFEAWLSQLALTALLRCLEIAKTRRQPQSFTFSGNKDGNA